MAIERIDSLYQTYFIVSIENDFKSKSSIRIKDWYGAEGKYAIRNIMYKNFKNFTFAKTVEYLKEKEIGDFIIRPSSLGDDCLTLSWKFYTNTYIHVNIKEENKIKGNTVG